MNREKGPDILGENPRIGEKPRRKWRRWKPPTQEGLAVFRQALKQHEEVVARLTKWREERKKLKS